MKHPDYDRYVAACNYPWHVDGPAVERHLGRYLTALGEERMIRRLLAGWTLEGEPAIARYIGGVIAKLPIMDARDAMTEMEAKVALAAVRAMDVKEARVAMDSTEAWAAMNARAATDLMPAMDARAARAMDATNADDVKRFATWCIQSNGKYYWRFECSYIATVWLGANTDAVRAWSGPLFESFCSGCWFLLWTDSTLYWIAKPTLHFIYNRRKQLHRTDGPAVESDVEPLHFLNGIWIPGDYDITHPHDLTAEQILREENADVRRELIRLVGIERLLSSLPHRVLNKQGDYEVLSVDFPGLIEDARFLKMKNPSIGVWHLEGVERECQTVQQAINWRAGHFAENEDWKPEILT